MTAEEVRIGDKYTVLRTLEERGNLTLSEVSAPGGELLRLAWFEIDTPEQRRDFFAYRDALRALQPAGLVDLVATPEANYAVWRPLAGQTLADFAALPARPEESLDSLRLMTQHLGEHGYALTDAEVKMAGRRGEQAVLAYLDPAPQRTDAEIARLNAPLLRPVFEGRTQRRSEMGWLSFVPGLLLLAGAGWYGYQATQSYLNPEVAVVKDVTGLPANEAAQQLAKSGFRVAYAEGEGGDAAIGSVLRQEPEGDTNMPLGRLVTLTVNSPPDLTVPRVEDLTVDRATVNLKESGFRLGTVTKIDGTPTQTPEGRIISQDPPAGLSTQRGQSVNVLVSTGIAGKETWIPDLTGLDFTSAREHARTAGLVITEVKPEESDLPENTVISQTPKPYTRIGSGEKMTLTVAAPKFSQPPATVGALPVPPAYVPPAPPPPLPEPEPEPAPGAPEETPAEPTPATGPDTVPATPAGEQGAQLRSVQLNYQFPADLPAGSYSIVVRDDAGQRVLMGATSSEQLAGAQASSTVQVTGQATFIILRDGEVFATSTP
ncbi:PASTA domain containing protein [Deinococcus proteolyticus MRP]|uniref:PASTA domain containing protein n=1 Tax=Deinococcus proteolyticus (strain ATCC 35074 / DSM 20540 / JCM 6276 / NBRC 101906 / NCIMB 13154 / VKM Ac-1939 / CCM 2703 / MRP) TaxID=693977 RepID=F0RLA1_DEIPM|nr:PASTA domain-containing protein [Deinococcus proteolyticus]ADY25805.1 PASTA domain containing protein [Deinococcus proteolyticus MRP]